MGDNGTFIFGDAGLEQNPDPEKLANIAISSAESFPYTDRTRADRRHALTFHKGQCKACGCR